MQRTHFLPALLFANALAAQSTCDSVQVEGMRYDPFGNGVQVTLFNGSAGFLSGPTVDLFDANGDTLGIGFQEFFGILSGSSSVHRVQFTPQPPTPFTGIIRLNYTDWDGPVTCEWSLADMQLCPPDSCSPLGVYAYQQGGAPVAMDIDWSVTDATNAVQASGVLQMEVATFGYAVEPLCLPPGDYTLHMSQAVAAGTIIQVGLTQDDFAWTSGTNTQLPPGGSVEHPFSFFGPCAEGTQSVREQRTAQPTLTVQDRSLTVRAQGDAPLGTLAVLDASGRVLRTVRVNDTSTTIELHPAAPGCYVLRALDARATWPAQRFILH